jgi:hypothetical protein
METLGNQIMPKLCPNYNCEICDYNTSKKSSYDNHNLSAKHIKRLKNHEMETHGNQIMPKLCSKQYTCENCNREFKNRSGLWKHNKICLKNENIDLKDKDNLIIQLLKQNGELQKSLIEMSKEKTVTNNNTTHTNSHNKTFNLNFYLNETCKDALNINDFVSSIKLSLEDLENTGRKGYVEGISNIIVKQLKGMEQYQRPIHCSDCKREVIYIKDNDKWEKECENKPILTKAIKVIANENIKKITEWRENNPDCTNSDSKKNNMYLKIVSNSMNGSDKEEGKKNITKIISNVAKETLIQKEI